MSAPSWLAELLGSERVTDICINGPERVFADSGCGMLPVAAADWSADALRGWALEQISAAGKTWDAKYPFLDLALSSGHRAHFTFPPLSPEILVSLRRLPQPGESRGWQERWRSSPHLATLIEAVRRGDSVLLSGATGSGKTTLARDLLGCVPADERILALEDTRELAPDHPHFVSLVSRPANADGFGEVSLRMLLRQALRMRPDRIVLGECRGAEVLDLLQVLNTGHRGAMATLHANSPRDALRRIELLCMLAGGNLPTALIRELVAGGVQWVAQLRRDGRERAITELYRVEGREGDTILMRPMVQPVPPCAAMSG